MSNCLSKWSYDFAFPPAKNQCSCCPISAPAFGVVSGLGFNLSNSYAVVFPCFNLQFSNNVGVVEDVVICLFTIIYLLWWDICSDLLLIFRNQIVNFLTESKTFKTVTEISPYPYQLSTRFCSHLFIYAFVMGLFLSFYSAL